MVLCVCSMLFIVSAWVTERKRQRERETAHDTLHVSISGMLLKWEFFSNNIKKTNKLTQNRTKPNQTKLQKKVQLNTRRYRIARCQEQNVNALLRMFNQIMATMMFAYVLHVTTTTTAKKNYSRCLFAFIILHYIIRLILIHFS